NPVWLACRHRWHPRHPAAASRSAFKECRSGRNGVASFGSAPGIVSRTVLFRTVSEPTTPTPDQRLERLLDRGEELGCVNLSELSELVQELDLDDAQAQELHDRIEQTGLAVTDDCGKERVVATTYANGELATTTTDALQLFL